MHFYSCEFSCNPVADSDQSNNFLLISGLDKARCQKHIRCIKGPHQIPAKVCNPGKQTRSYLFIEICALNGVLHGTTAFLFNLFRILIVYYSYATPEVHIWLDHKLRVNSSLYLTFV